MRCCVPLAFEGSFAYSSRKSDFVPMSNVGAFATYCSTWDDRNQDIENMNKGCRIVQQREKDALQDATLLLRSRENVD